MSIAGDIVSESAGNNHNQSKSPSTPEAKLTDTFLGFLREYCTYTAGQIGEEDISPTLKGARYKYREAQNSPTRPTIEMLYLLDEPQPGDTETTAFGSMTCFLRTGAGAPMPTLEILYNQYGIFLNDDTRRRLDPHVPEDVAFLEQYVQDRRAEIAQGDLELIPPKV
jgi:hypothetical protein